MTKLCYRNFSETRSCLQENQIDKKENFWGSSRTDVTVFYQNKDPEKDHSEIQSNQVTLNPEQVKSCSKLDQLSLVSTTLIIIIASAGIIFIIIIVSIIICFIRRKKAEKPKTGVDTNPEYGADYYYKQNQETYEGEVQYVS